MASQSIQILGVMLALLGWLGTIITCALPMWRVTAFIGANIVTAQVIWEGLWMNCVVQSTGQMQCKVYDSLLALPQDLQAARAMVIISVLVGVFGVLMAVIGGKCTNCMEDESSKAKACIVSGVIFIIAGFLILIPVSWSAQTVIRDFYNPLLSEAQRRELNTMAASGLQALGLALALIGWIGVIVICALPMWKVTAFIGQNIVTAQTFWEGLWMNCVMQSTGQMQCKVYDSMLALPRDLQAARAMVIISILVSLFGLLLGVAGGKCTNCIEDGAAKARVCVVAGILFLIGGVLCLIPVSWSAHTVILDFYNPVVAEAQKRELGASLFIGWGAAALLMLGGALLCCQCPKNESRGYSAKYTAPRSNAHGGNYV
ncbi:claudin-like protein ZF-A89 [Trichomycterus rosablanca]|uniref:claudin-like protein ZF-A89 n=1 Tax=Trichomycterus rosablanca TaxID=2290929 RepID=UPI002F35AC74